MRKTIILFTLLLCSSHFVPLRANLQADSTKAAWERHINEVEVTEKKTTHALSVFKTLYLAEKPYLSNLTAASILQQIPSLNTDIEGNIRLRGSNKATLLYEGIPITLFEENRGDLLIQLPAALFASVLTYNMLPVNMTNEGEAGAVDFTFSPDFADKSISKISLATGSNNRYNASLLTGAGTNKFKWQLGYDYRQEYRYRAYQKTTTDKTGIAQMNNNAAAHPQTHMAMFNAQYLLSPSDFVDFNMLFSRMNYDRLGNINNKKTNTAGSVIANVLRIRDNTEKQTGTSEGIKWKHLWKEQKAEMDATFNYDNFNYDQGNNFMNKKPGTDVILAQDRLFIEQKKHQWFASARLSKEFTPSLSGQVGYTGQWHTDKYAASDDDLLNGIWVHNTTKSNDYRLTRNMNCGFAEINYKSKKIQYSLGLQAEFDSRTGSKPTDINPLESNNFYILPHAEFSFLGSPFSSWTLRYQERLNRPVLNDLNPFTDTSDATYVHAGNPNLTNEKIHIAELSNTLRIKSLTINPVVFYRYRTNQIVDIATVANGSTVWHKENANDSQDAGVEVNLKWKPASLITAEASATGYHYEIDGARQGYGIKSTNAIDAKGSLSLHLPLQFTWEIYGYYTDRQLTVQGEIAALGNVGSSLSWNGLSKHLNVALSIDNLFDSVEEKTTFNTSGTQQVIYRNRDARAGWLSVTYRL